MEIKKLDRPIESYIREIEKTIGDGDRIYLDELYAKKLRTILKQIVDKFGNKENGEQNVLSELKTNTKKDHHCEICGDYIKQDNLKVCDKCASEYKF